MRVTRLSKNAAKRAVRAWEYGDRSERRNGAVDAIRDAMRALRAGSLPTGYPDSEDFYGRRLSDSTSGYRYVRAYDAATEDILKRLGVML